jgi:NADH-quinone oxidoreductase subunit M
VVSVTYFLRMYERSMLGPLKEDLALPDLGARETLLLGGLVALVFWLGLYPASFLDPIKGVTAGIANLVAVAPGAIAEHVVH